MVSKGERGIGYTLTLTVTNHYQTARKESQSDPILILPAYYYQSNKATTDCYLAKLRNKGRSVASFFGIC